jgi:penicillin-binding protein A
MNRKIMHLGLGLMAMYLALFAMLTYTSVLHADTYNANPLNNRDVVRSFAQNRGSIQSADGIILAESVPSDDKYKYQRRYPSGDLFGHITGWYSFALGSDGVERTYDDVLAGQTVEQQVKGLTDLFISRERVGDVVLTMRADLQQIAKEQLGNREGSIVMIDPRDGAILAMWSWPSFDPNVLADHNLKAAQLAREAFDKSPGKPMLPQTFRERFFPGSTFKLVTASAALENGQITIDSQFPVETSWVPPQTTRPISNFGGSKCGGTFIDIIRKSCNVAFAKMGVNVGPDGMVSAAERFGFNATVPLDLPRPAVSRFPTANEFVDNTPKLAQSSFGQNDVAATPLQMAMVAAAVATNGTIYTPHVMSEVRDSDGQQVQVWRNSIWRQPFTPPTAAALKTAMIEVVNNGTAKAAGLPLIQVAGKTGTAQLGTDPPSSHAWFVGFAPADNPTVAIAILVKAQPGVSEITGGKVAAPIANAMLSAFFRLPIRTPAP